MHYYYGPIADKGDWWLGGLIGAGLFVLFLALAALIIMRLTRHHHHAGWSQQHHTGLPQHRDPLDIAKDRYAKGEIDKAQFEQLQKDLKP